MGFLLAMQGRDHSTRMHDRYAWALNPEERRTQEEGKKQEEEEEEEEEKDKENKE